MYFTHILTHSIFHYILPLFTWISSQVNNTSLRRIKITAEDVRNMMLALIAVVLVYLSIFTGVGMPFESAIDTVTSNQRTLQMRCSMNHIEFQTTFFAIEGVMYNRQYLIHSI